MIFKKQTSRSGFTIVELLVVIAVIGILAGLVMFGYNSWQKRAAETVVASDLKGAVAAMESSRNFGAGYPGSIPDTFTASPDVNLSYVSGDGKDFCIQASSISQPQVKYFVNTTDNTKEPRKGDCINGESTDPAG